MRPSHSIRPPLVATILAVAVAAVAPRAEAQRSALLARAGGVSPAADSAATLERARGAQRRFERARRGNLPVTMGYASGRCDVRVGRFCYWHDDGAEPPAEPPRIASDRALLLTRLGEAGARIPRDEWVLGQRVRYLVEAARERDAASLASACGAGDDSTADDVAGRTRSWCDALAGFALHVGGAYAAADSAFARALDGMPPEERCRWNDLSDLLDGDRAKRYRALRCGERDAFERRFWALARPLHLTDANDARTEHLARRVMSRLQQQASDAYDMAWGDDARELLMRYGWATRWARTPPSATDPGGVHVIGHEPSPGFEFPPGDEAFADPWRAAAEGWTPRNPLAYTRYAPRWAAAIVDAPHQVALFRRGDSSVVVAAIDLRADTLFRRDSIRVALAILADSSDSATVVHTVGARRLARLADTTRSGRALVSIEALDDSARHAARARFAVAPPSASDSSTVLLSDVLLLEGADSLPPTLDAAAARARGSMRVVSDRLGAFWELYPRPGADSVVRYTLTVRPSEGGLLRRLSSRIGLTRAREPVRMEWEEPLARLDVVPRALAIDLSGLPSGRYTLQLEAAGARAVREIELAR